MYSIGNLFRKIYSQIVLVENIKQTGKQDRFDASSDHQLGLWTEVGEMIPETPIYYLPAVIDCRVIYVLNTDSRWPATKCFLLLLPLDPTTFNSVNIRIEISRLLGY